MHDDLRSILADLRDELVLGGARVAVIDARVAEAMRYRDAACAAPLLLLLRDDAEYQEGMYTLLHAAESFAEAAYVGALLGVLPELGGIAPERASVALGRVLNDARAGLELARQLRAEDGIVKAAVRAACDRIDASRPDPPGRTAAIRAAAGRHRRRTRTAGLDAS